LSGHVAVTMENAALRVQLLAFQRKRKRPTLTSFDRLFWVGLSDLARFELTTSSMPWKRFSRRQALEGRGPSFGVPSDPENPGRPRAFQVEMGPQGMGVSTAADPWNWFRPVPRAGTLGSYSSCVRYMRAWACSTYGSPMPRAETIGCDARTGTTLTMAGPSLECE
jgi:hypothetical protein